jgi:Sec-independent protein translocase protein TatA
MGKEKLYKKMAIVFAIIALVFAVLFFTNDNSKISETLQNVSSRLGECRDNIAMWASRDNSGTTTSDTERQLSDILRECSSAVEEAQEQI